MSSVYITHIGKVPEEEWNQFLKACEVNVYLNECFIKLSERKNIIIWDQIPYTYDDLFKSNIETDLSMKILDALEIAYNNQEDFFWIYE